MARADYAAGKECVPAWWRRLEHSSACSGIIDAVCISQIAKAEFAAVVRLLLSLEILLISLSPRTAGKRLPVERRIASMLLCGAFLTSAGIRRLPATVVDVRTRKCGIVPRPRIVPLRVRRAQLTLRSPRWRAAASGGEEVVDRSGGSNVERSFGAKVLALLSPKPVDRAIAKIALPALGTLALDPLVALADMACVGRLGRAALGGVGVSNNVFNLSFTCFNFLGMATTPAIARAFGSGDEKQASRLIAQALWVAVVSGLIAMALLFRYSVPVVKFFGASPAIVPSATSYLRARIVAAPFFLSSMVANGAFRGFQDTRTPLLVGIIANLINITLYPTLIFGFGMGIAGAGIATAAGQIVAGLSLFTLLIRTARLKLADLSRIPRPQDVFPLLRTGCVLSVRTLSIFTTISYATATAARLGTVEAAAFEIGRQVFALFARLLDAISVAAQSLVALALGHGDYSRARHTANRILQLGVALGTVFVVVLMAGINNVPGIFTSDVAVRAMVKKTFPIMAVIQPINGLVFVFDGIFTAGRRFSYLSTAIFFSALCSMFMLRVVRSCNFGLGAVWMGLNLMMVLRATLLGIGYFTNRGPVPPKEEGQQRSI